MTESHVPVVRAVRVVSSGLVAGQGLAALDVMVDDALRVAVVVSCGCRHGSWAAAPGRWAFGHPPPDVGPCRGRTGALGDRVEDPEIGRGVGAGASHPLPAVCVRREVPVAQQGGKCRAPCGHQRWRSLTRFRGDHPDPVVHPPRRGQLAHPCVDEGIAGAALLPGREMRSGSSYDIASGRRSVHADRGWCQSTSA